MFYSIEDALYWLKGIFIYEIYRGIIGYIIGMLIGEMMIHTYNRLASAIRFELTKRGWINGYYKNQRKD